jgi:hypothetical protein
MFPMGHSVIRYIPPPLPKVPLPALDPMVFPDTSKFDTLVHAEDEMYPPPPKALPVE